MTGAQPLLALTTLIVSVNGVPGFPSRTSLRTNCPRDGYGPAVSDGVTTQVPLVDVVVDVVGVVVAAVVLDGLVGVLPHAAASVAPAAAPSAPNAVRRLTVRPCREGRCCSVCAAFIPNVLHLQPI